MYFGSFQAVCIFLYGRLTRHVMLSEDSFLHVGYCKMHNALGGSHMHLQASIFASHTYSHLHVLGWGQA
jgi:hypothetical protein